ncbi:MAG TPA: cardiolipin synthase [Gemmatimonadaceae bacterium]|nr:cardiolipin synthase [Gemmatimonadaceae bacterium]
MIKHWFDISGGWWVAFVVVEWSLRLFALVIIPFRRSADTAKAWLALIFFEPILGGVLYLMFGRARIPPVRAERAERFRTLGAPVRARLLAHPEVFHPAQLPAIEPAVRLAEQLGDMPILGGNSVEVLSDYEGIIDRLAADIDAAASSVHLLFYIIADDPVAWRVLAAVERAAARGVRCRVLGDEIGSRSLGYERVIPRLRAAGVEAELTMRVRLLRRRSARIDLRNHRKIAVIDGRTAYTGSLNLVDPSFKPGLTYEELMVRVTGPVVAELQAVFAQDWFQETGRPVDIAADFPDPRSTGAVAAQVLPSSPMYPRQNSQRLIVALLGMARERAVITTPYFIPDDVLRQALTTAVLRGVDVRLVVPAQDDQLLVSNAQKSYYLELLTAGVRICRYGRRFLHAKHVTIDDDIAWIGSSNMDIRSFALNAEVVLLAYSRDVCAQLRAAQERYFADGEWLEAATWGAQPLWRQVGWNVARLFGSLL